MSEDIPPDTNNSMTLLQTAYKDRDCILTQVERRGSFAVFHRTKGDRCRGYEVIYIRTDKGNPAWNIEPGERYPTANGWGRDGISIPDHETAMLRLEESVALGKLATIARTAAVRIAPAVKNPRKRK